MDKPLNILQVHTSDAGGGAEQFAAGLHRTFLDWGHNAFLLVGRKRGRDPDVLEIPQTQRWPGQCRLMRLLERRMGLQYLYAPGSHRLLELTPFGPDVILLHSLHGAGGYFDLAALPALTRGRPAFLFLQDMWTLTGHCGYSLGCERWRTGCGQCPDLTIYPAIATDGTRRNWRRKRRLFARSSFQLGAPCKWLLDLAEQSPLLAGREQFMIPNAADTSVFKPGSREDARARLGLPPDGRMVLFLANRGARAPFKDFDCLARALGILAARGVECRLVTVGGEPDAETRSALPEGVVFRPFAAERDTVADYYRAADVFCHATKEDVCPLTVLESQACGTPVVATNVGGIPETVLDGRTATLAPVGDADALAAALERLITDPELSAEMGRAAAVHAAQNYSLTLQAERFLDLFRSAIAHRENDT